MLCSSTTAAINLDVVVVRSVFDPTNDVLKQSLHCELTRSEGGRPKPQGCVFWPLLKQEHLDLDSV